MSKTARTMLFVFIAAACTTVNKPYDVSNPLNVLEGECRSNTFLSDHNWLALACTLRNTSEATIMVEFDEDIEVEGQAWQKPDSIALDQLRERLKRREEAKTLPLLEGPAAGGGFEQFLAQAIVNSGIWLVRIHANSSGIPASPKPTLIPPGQKLEQVFILNRISSQQPDSATLKFKQPARGVKTFVIFEDSSSVRKRPNG